MDFLCTCQSQAVMSETVDFSSDASIIVPELQLGRSLTILGNTVSALQSLLSSKHSMKTQLLVLPQTIAVITKLKYKCNQVTIVATVTKNLAGNV